MTPAALIASEFLSVIGRSTGDCELKKKIRKSDMTIETITTLIHEHMYDRLNESNNSNDEKKIKHVQERPYKRKRTDKTDQDKLKRRPENQRYKQRDNRCGQCDNAAHQIEQDNIYARRKWQNADTVKEKDTMRKCADRKESITLKKQPHQQKTTGITTKSKELTITNIRKISIMQRDWATMYQ